MFWWLFWNWNVVKVVKSMFFACFWIVKMACFLMVLKSCKNERVMVCLGTNICESILTPLWKVGFVFLTFVVFGWVGRVLKQKSHDLKGRSWFYKFCEKLCFLWFCWKVDIFTTWFWWPSFKSLEGQKGVLFWCILWKYY